MPPASDLRYPYSIPDRNTVTLYTSELALRPDGTLGPLWLRVGGDGRFADVSRGALPGEPVALDGLVLPGIPNLHSHAFQRALAGRTEQTQAGTRDSFWSWRETMYGFLAELTPDHVEAIATRLYVEMLEAGYTRVVEFHYLHRDPRGNPYSDPHEMAVRLVAAARRSGIGLTLLPVVYDAAGFGGVALQPEQRRFRMGVEEALDLRRSIADQHRDVGTGMALHSLRGVSPQSLAQFNDARSEWSGLPIHIHVAEQTREVEDCRTWSGARPVEWLLNEAPVGPDWCLVHATHVTETELQGVARSGAVVGLCPTTEANLGDGLFPLAELLQLGGRWGVGSDSHVSVDPVEELRWLEYGQRLTRRSRNVVAPPLGGSTAGALVAGACAGGAAASGEAVGALATGRLADLVVLDTDHPIFAGHGPETYLDAWVFSGNRSPVRRVMSAGRWVVEGGRHHRSESSLVEFRRALAGMPSSGPSGAR